MLKMLKLIKTRGLEALTRMLFFKFIIGLCVTIEARKRN